MIGKKINQLATELAPASTDLTIIGNPTTGVSKKITLAQLGAIFSGAVSFYTNLASFPATGTLDVIFCAKDTQKLYLWSGSAYVEVFPSQALLDTYQLRSEKGVSNGYASLDSSGKVPISQLPSSIMEYKGTWNAATNTPTLANGTGDTGDVYICNVAGTVNFGAGPITFAVGDYVIYSGSIWQRSSGAVGTVTSVAASITGNAIGITGSPVTTSGTLAFAFAGTGAQYIKGDGTLATFPSTIAQSERLITEVYNSTGATLTKGTIVYINGGQGNLPTVTKALATGDSTSAQTFGVVQADITNNNNGYVVVAGKLSDLDTQAYTEGTQLYLSSTTAGAWTSTKQYAPAHLVYVGIVVRSHPTQGIVEIKIQNGYELDELHNVAAQTPTNNDGLFWESATSLWKNKSISTILGGTPVTGSGTLYALTKWGFTSGAIINSNLYDTGSVIYNNNATAGAFAVQFNGNATSGMSYGLLINAGSDANDIALRIQNVSSTSEYFFVYGDGKVKMNNIPNATTDTDTFLVSDGGFIKYRTGAQLLSDIGGQAALTNPVTGTGTTNTLPKFTGASTIGNSNITDTGSLITLGSATRINGNTGIGGAALTTFSVGALPTAELGSTSYGSAVIQGVNYTLSNTQRGILDINFNGLTTQDNGATLTFTNNAGQFLQGYNYVGAGIKAGKSNATNQNQSTYLSFHTNGSGTLSERLRLTSGGALLLGTTSSTATTFVIGKDITGAASSYGTLSNGLVKIDVSSNAYNYASSLQTDAVSWTLPNYFHYLASQGTIGSGSVITNQFGFVAESSMIGATNNYGFYGNIASGTNRWNLYMNGTANNYMAGSLGIGSTALTGYNVRIQKTLTGATGARNVWIDGLIASDVTTSAVMFGTSPQTQATAFTLGTLYHFYANNTINGAGSTITNNYGFFADSNLTQGTNAYGFYGNIASGTNRWNIYMNGTAANYLNGDTSIGTTTGGFKLNVGGTLNVTGAATFSSTISATQFFADVTSGTNQLVLKTGGIDRGYIQASNASLILNSLTSNDIQFHSNSTERMRLNASGNLSIGNTNDSYKLDVSGSTIFRGKFNVSTNISDYTATFVNSNSSSYGLYIQAGGTYNAIDVYNAAGTTQIFKLTGAGAGTFYASSAALSLSNASDLWLNISRGSSFVNIGVDSTGTFYNTSSNHRWLYNSGSNEAMRITSGGNVGIGTTSPGSYILALNTSASQGINLNGTGTGGSWFLFSNSGTANGYIASSYHVFLGGSQTDFAVRAENNLCFGTGTTERMRIKSNGIINLSNVPSSSAGLSSGDIYKTVAGVLMIV